MGEPTLLLTLFRVSILNLFHLQVNKQSENSLTPTYLNWLNAFLPPPPPPQLNHRGKMPSERQLRGM